VNGQLRDPKDLLEEQKKGELKMAVETTYICDRCKTRQDTSEGMWKIYIAITHWANYTPSLRDFGVVPDIKQTNLWCRECTNLFHLTPSPKEKPAPSPPTFEDLLQELVGEMVADAINDQG
jgi:hypothetical protein